MAEKIDADVKQGRLDEAVQVIGNIVKIAAFFFSLCSFMLGMAIRMFNILRIFISGIFKGPDRQNNGEPPVDKGNNTGVC